MSSKNRGSAAASKRAARRAPQHRMDAGRHREPSRTVSELTAGPATVGVKLAAVGVLGSAAALAVPTLASAASVSPAGSTPAPQGPQPPSGVVATGCVGGGCIAYGVYNNGARVVGLGAGTPSGEIAVQYGPPPSQSSVGAAFSVDSPFGGRGKLIFDSAKGISWQASASANSGGFTVGQTYAPGQGWVWDNTQPSSNYRIGLRDNVMVYYKYVPPQTDWTQPAQTGDGTTSYPPGYQVPAAPPLKDWTKAFGPDEGGPPLSVPPVAPAAPASADPAPATPAAPASADPAPPATPAAPAADSPPAQPNDWSTAFGPSEGGPPLDVPPAAAASAAPAADPAAVAPASADPAPAAPASAPVASVAPAVDPASLVPVADPFAGLAPGAPVYNPVINTGVGGFSSMGLGTGIDPLSGLSTGISSPLNTGIGTNLDAGLTSSVPGVPSMPSVAPIDNPTISLGDTSFSSMDLGMSSDPMGGGGFSGGAAS